MEITTNRNGSVRKPRPNLVIEPVFRMEPIAAIAFEIDKHWDFVRFGIEEVMARSHFEGMACSRVKRDEARCMDSRHLIYRYRPEHVYLLLCANRATLYLTWLKNRLTGFIICQTLGDGTEQPRLGAWIAYFRDHQTRYFCAKELENLARSLKMREIRMESSRKGWLMHKPTVDWEISTARGWQRDLTHADRQALRLAPTVTLRRLLPDG